MATSRFAKRILFEVCLHNARVRKALRELEPNKTGFADKWEEDHYLEVEAVDEDAAARRIYSQYPQRSGFVITAVRRIEQGG